MSIAATVLTKPTIPRAGGSASQCWAEPGYFTPAVSGVRAAVTFSLALLVLIIGMVRGAMSTQTDTIVLKITARMRAAGPLQISFRAP